MVQPLKREGLQIREIVTVVAGIVILTVLALTLFQMRKFIDADKRKISMFAVKMTRAERFKESAKSLLADIDKGNTYETAEEIQSFWKRISFVMNVYNMAALLYCKDHADRKVFRIMLYKEMKEFTKVLDYNQDYPVVFRKNFDEAISLMEKEMGI